MDNGTISINSSGRCVSATVTRTADTNVYATNDVIGPATGSTAAITISGLGAANETVQITDTTFLVALTAVPATMTSFTLHLYNVTPPSALGDNVAWDLPSGDRASYLGSVTLGTPADIGASLYIQTTGLLKTVKLGAGGNLFAYLVTVGTFTPTSAEVYQLSVCAHSFV
tara:strand:- start:475 stop:984 length:510 start_codon:yes stop_codon:yes gene_type:complete